MAVTNSQIIDAYIAWKSKSGWIVTNVTDSGAQFKLAKTWNKLGIWIGLLTIWFFGVGLIFWVLTILDYLLKKDKIIFVSVQKMETELKARKKGRYNGRIDSKNF